MCIRLLICLPGTSIAQILTLPLPPESISHIYIMCLYNVSTVVLIAARLIRRILTAFHADCGHA